MSHPADNLIAAWLADDLDADGVRALEEHLRRDPAARARFARFCQAETVLPQALAVAPVRSGTTALRRALRKGSRRMRLRRPSGRLGWLMPISAAAALVAVVVMVGVTRSASPVNPPMAWSGPLEVQVIADQSQVLCDGRPLRVGEQAPIGGVVEVSGSRAEFRWRDGTQLATSGATSLRVVDGTTAVELRNGRLEARVTTRDTTPFRIDARHASATVMGTRFTLTTDSATTTLTVSEGRVRFNAGDALREVIAGESASADQAGLRLEAGVRVFGFVPTAREATRVLGQRLVRRGTLRLADLPADGMNLRIECPPEVKSVRTGLREGGTQRLEQVRDYFVFGDRQNVARGAWKPRVGTFIIDAQPCADAEGGEPLGPSVELELTIVP